MFKFLLMSCILGLSLSTLAEPYAIEGKDVNCEGQGGLISFLKGEYFCVNIKGKKPFSGTVRKYASSTLVSESEVKNGKREGVRREYYESGQLQGEWTYKNGIKEGPSKTYYENGQIESNANFHNDRQNGRKTMYYKNGQIWVDGNMKNDVPSGTLLTYYENGLLKAEDTFSSDGTIKGIIKTYYANGQVSGEEVYEQNIRTRKGKTLKKTTYNVKGQETENNPEILEELWQAIHVQNKDKIKSILKEYPSLHLDPPFVHGQINKPLFLAARDGDVEVLQLLLDHGADIEGICSYEDTPLISALENHKYENAKFLIENGANVNAPNSFGMTPFMGLVGYGPFDLFKLALEKGGDLNAVYPITVCTIKERNSKGRCPERYSKPAYTFLSKDLPEATTEEEKQWLEETLNARKQITEFLKNNKLLK